MQNIVDILKFIPILIAAALLGNWFLSEFKRAKATGAPWYKAYISVPGLLILLAILVVPMVLWLMSH